MFKTIPHTLARCILQNKSQALPAVTHWSTLQVSWLNIIYTIKDCTHMYVLIPHILKKENLNKLYENTCSSVQKKTCFWFIDKERVVYKDGRCMSRMGPEDVLSLRMSTSN